MTYPFRHLASMAIPQVEWRESAGILLQVNVAGDRFVLLGAKNRDGVLNLEMPGGKVELSDETLFKAACREFREETGISIDDLEGSIHGAPYVWGTVFVDQDVDGTLFTAFGVDISRYQFGQREWDDFADPLFENREHREFESLYLANVFELMERPAVRRVLRPSFLRSITTEPSASRVREFVRIY